MAHVEFDVRDLRVSQKDFAADQKEVLATLSRLEVQIAKLPVCSSPNACLALTENQTRITKIIEDMESRLRLLESAENKMVGGFKTILMVSTIVSWIGGMLISPVIMWLKQLLRQAS